jgi:predicted DNA-binding transcriptional regulator YafY
VRASRLVNLLLLLQTRGGQSAPELARELEVSVRTIYRDVEALSGAGVPIYADRGPQGGIRLVDGYRTRLTGLTDEEAKALFLSGMPGPAAQLGFGTVVVAARLKVLAALPPELRARASRISERFHLDAPGWFQVPEEVPYLESLAESVWEERQVDVEYRRSDGSVVARRIEPLGLVLKAGVWYLVARAEGQDRTYRVSRFVSATVLADRFERPADFEVGAFWSEAIAAYERELPRVEVTVRIAREHLPALGDVIGKRRLEAAVAGAIDDPLDGFLRLTVTYEDLWEALGPMLSLGARAEVLAPEELRDRILDAARGIVRAYADRPDREPASAALSAPALSVPAPGEVAARPPARGRR